MFETILLGFVTWQALAILIVCGIWAEYTESQGLAVFFGILAAISAYFYFGIPLADIAVYAVGYVVIGVVWSFYRYKRFIVKKLEEIDRGWGKIENYHPTQLLSEITCWIIVWPFSLVENLCGDIINGIETLVKRVFKGVYNRIYEKAVADTIRKNEGVR